jgi:hypothetical protein
MLDVGLCMTVRDEAANIVSCLAPIAELFAEIVVIDTGSHDGTQALLRDAIGINPWSLELDEAQCYSLARGRNHGFDRLRTPWLMTLDADERIDPEQLKALLALDDGDLPAGLFCRWDTHPGDGEAIEDYKLSLFRSAHRHHGLIHDTAQPSLRAAGERACWAPQLTLLHYPDNRRREDKDRFNGWRLACAREREPHWLRYHWFSGYLAYRHGRLQEAEQFFSRIHAARPALFPVESLNASMLLATIAAGRADRRGAVTILDDALQYHASVADDFEVSVNFRLEPWLRSAYERAERGELDDIRPYRFPY